MANYYQYRYLTFATFFQCYAEKWYFVDIEWRPRASTFV